MVSIASLWLPIVVSAVLVFVVSSLMHMVLKFHQKDYKKLPNEDEALAVLRKATLPPGLYHFPHCAEMKEMGSPEMKAKLEQGPVGFLAILPSGPPAMGKFLGIWFGYLLLVGFFLAYVAGRSLGAGTDYLAVFRLVGAVAFMTYGLSEIVQSVWRGAPWSNTFRGMFDGLLYALVSAGAFGWLWPR
jgi:hypothetical protein